MVAAVLAANSLAGYAQTARNSDPVFGIQYNPKLVHFDKAPPLIAEACKDMQGKDLVMFAHFTDRNTQYFIVQEDLGEFGVAVAIRGKHCTEIDSDRFLYEGTDALANQGIAVRKREGTRVLDGIALDIVNRYSKAFGGREKLLNALGPRANIMPNSAFRTDFKRYIGSE